MVIEYVGASPFTLDFWILLGAGLLAALALAILTLLILKKEEAK